MKLYCTESLEEGEAPDVQLELSYVEALDLARALMAREAELQARESELETRCTQLGENLVRLFEAEEQRRREYWQQQIGFYPEEARDFGEVLQAAYARLKEDQGRRFSTGIVKMRCKEYTSGRRLAGFFMSGTLIL